MAYGQPLPSLPSDPKFDNIQSLPTCPVYSVRGDEPWITSDDMGLLKALIQRHSLTRHNGDTSDMEVKSLPPGCKLGKMVGEGAANAVFEVHLPDGSQLTHQNTRLLLRLAKSPVDGRSKFNYLEQCQYYHSHVKPILGSYILHQELVILHHSGIIDSINDFLNAHDHQRKVKFRGSLVEPSTWGFLVEDMRPEDPDESLLVEFKPKWLSQSPSAPKNAIRCRQCAKELHSYITEPSLKKPVPTRAKPCPMTLGRDEGARVNTESPYRLMPHLNKLGDRLSATLNILRDEEAFKCLRRAQEANDTVGPLHADESDFNFALAMTLRDCSCFAQIATRPGNSKGPLKIRFGDVDMKAPESRLDYWRKVEEELIDGGFYTAGWILCGQEHYLPPTKCVLELALDDRRQEEPEIIYLKNRNSTNGRIPLSFDGEAKVYVVDTDVSLLKQCLEPYKENSSFKFRPS